MGESIALFLINAGLNASFWYIGFKYDPQGVIIDLKYVAGALSWIYGDALYSKSVHIIASTWKIAIIALAFLTTPYCVIRQLSNEKYAFQTERRSMAKGRKTQDAAPSHSLKPLVFPCRTTHTRMFPKKHTFSYSYLFVGIPVGWHGSLGSLLSADLEGCHTETEKIKLSQLQQHSWFHVEAADYLERGRHDLGLKGKLDMYLKSQNEDPEDYAHAYLITAPKFLGYSFNPVSFWYLYTEQKELKAMILEVNNTFDERRMYFLKNMDDKYINKQRVSSNHKFEDGACDNSEKTASAEVYRTSQNPAKFATKWAKDFHVSPFNSRKGSYTLNAYDPFFPELSGSGFVNNTITLSSSKDHVKLVARVFSTRDGIDPSLGGWERLRFVVAWWWVGFVTFPRIVREAGKLFFQRKLHVWFRPEVLKDSIGRRETADERIIEQCFRDFLQSQVENSNLDKPLKYTSAISIGPNVNHEIFHPKSLRNENPNSDTITAEESITLKIVTPLFYSLLVLDPNPAKFLSSSVQPSSPHPPTFHISHPALLASLFSPSQLPDPASPNPSASNTISTNPCQPPSPGRCWSLLARLRRNPHPLDQHSSRLPVVLRRQYRTTVLKLLLSDTLFFGLPIIADITSAAVKVALCYLYASTLVAALTRFESPMDSKDGRGSGGYSERAAWIDVLGLMGIHVWRLLSTALGIVI